MKETKGMGERRSPKAGRLLSAAALLLAVLLAVTVGYAAAKYVTEPDATLSAGVDSFKVTSEIKYTDDWGESEAFNNNLGVMVFPSTGGISFTITVTNDSAVAVTCSITLNDGYSFSSSNLTGCTLSEGVITLDSPIPAKSGDIPGSASASFTVERDTSYTFDEDGYYTDVDVYTRDLEITVTYAQAE